jgi:hypothetical protein
VHFLVSKRTLSVRKFRFRRGLEVTSCGEERNVRLGGGIWDTVGNVGSNATDPGSHGGRAKELKTLVVVGRNAKLSGSGERKLLTMS